MINKIKNTKGVAVIVENKKGEFLLHLRDENAPHMKSQWCLLGGRVESKSKETLEHAVVREIEEETGVVVEPKKIKLFKKIILRDGTHESYIYHVLLDLSDEEIIIGEGKEFKFFSRTELFNIPEKLEYTNSFLEVLAEFIKLKYHG